MNDIPIGVREYVRSMIPSVLYKDPASQTEFAQKRWGAGARSTMIVKAAVGALGTEDLPLASLSAANVEYFDYLKQLSILQQLIKLGARDTSLNTPTLSMVNGATAVFVSEHKPIPVSKLAVEGSRLAPRKLGVIVPFPKSLLREMTPKTEALFIRDITNSPALAMSQAFLDPSNAGSDSTPASPLNGVTPISSSGNFANDVSAMLDGYTGDPATSVLIMDGRTIVPLVLAGPNFQDAGPRGGFIAGMPLVISAGSPREGSPSTGQIVLLDVAMLAVALEGVEVTTSENATLVMSDDPENEVTPQRIALYQNDMAAIKLILRCNWELQREGAIRYVTDADYSA